MHGFVSDKLRRILLSQLFQELLVCVAQLPDVDLHLLGQVHKHERILGLSSGGHVQSDSCNIANAATLNEVVVGRKLVPPNSLVFDRLSNLQGVCEFLDFASSVHFSLLPAPHPTKTAHRSSHGIGVSLVLSDEAALDNSRSARRFAEGDLCHNVALLDDLTAVVAYRTALVGVADVRLVATFRSFRFRGSHRRGLRFSFGVCGLVDVPGTCRF